jgi:hypothetical protein
MRRRQVPETVAPRERVPFGASSRLGAKFSATQQVADLANSEQQQSFSGCFNSTCITPSIIPTRSINHKQSPLFS